jgi:hypothetical protein
MIYGCPALEFAVDNHLLKLPRLQNSFPHHWKFSKAHTGPRFAHGFQTSVHITKLYRQQAEVIQNHENANVLNIGQGEPRHRQEA